MRQFQPGLFVLLLLFSCDTENKLKIALQPYENFNPSFTDSIKNTLHNIYGADVYVLEPKSLPKSAFTSLKTPRYRADALIKLLKKEKPDSIDFILGLTTADISTTKRDQLGRIKKPESKYEDWGIFGLGYRPGQSSVVSTYRIGNSDQSIFINRLKKICTHEIGHNLGLKHCTSSENCVMRDAVEKISTVDFVDLTLCHTCKTKINLK